MHLSRCSHSPGRRPHLISYKMLALSSLVLATLLLSSPAARAGHWEFSCTGSGNVTTTYSQYGIDRGQPSPAVYNWVALTAPQSGSFNLGSTFGGGGDYAVSAVASINVTVTATWQPDPALPSDPAPPSVWLCESTSTRWTYGHSGKASDGLGPEYKLDPNGGGYANSSDAPASPVGSPPPYWKKWTVSGGTVTLPARTLSAEADSPITNDFPDGDLCDAYVESYSVTVHPQPYNWHVTNGQGQVNSDGTLYYVFDYSSTDGNKADLTSCYEHERVTYQGPDPFLPPYPFTQSLKNPTVLPGIGNQGDRLSDTQYLETDTQHVVAFSPPPYSQFTGTSFTATQKFQFDDIATGEADVLIPGPDSLNTITRSIESRPGYPPSQWWYSCTKTNSAGGSLKSWLPAAQN